MKYVLVNDKGEVIRQQAFPEGVIPDVLPKEKGLTWMKLVEVKPTVTASEKTGETTVTVDLATGTVTREYTKVDKAPEEIMADTVAAIQALLDRTAQERNYDDIFTLVSYRDDPDLVFQAEGAAGFAWRSACWAKAREIKEAVMAGTRPLPTVAEALAELPLMKWPEV